VRPAGAAPAAEAAALGVGDEPLEQAARIRARAVIETTTRDLMRGPRFLRGLACVSGN
jgi:hypothetical protein